MTTNIFMLGMPSSGKSTLGRQLAKELNYDFIDLDKKLKFRKEKRLLKFLTSTVKNISGKSKQIN